MPFIVAMRERSVVQCLVLAISLVTAACGTDEPAASADEITGDGDGSDTPPPGDQDLGDPGDQDATGETDASGDPGSQVGDDVPGDDGGDAEIPANVCGDGQPAGEEQCDDGNPTDGDGCDTNCTPTACGNGIITGTEVCDDGNPTEGDGCDTNCTPTACGNGIITGTEVCDDGNPTEGDGCDTNCTATACGNGIVTGVELCDDGNIDDTDGCSASCTLRVAPTVTSASTVTLWVEQTGSFTIATSGVPTATIVLSGDPLPPSLIFADQGDGTARISGKPVLADAGSYTLTVTAANGVAPDGTQDLTLDIVEPPAMATSAVIAHTLTTGTDTSITYSIANTGVAALEYAIVTDGKGSTTLYEATNAGVASGFRSTIFTDPATAGSKAQFSADDFVLSSTTSITSLSAAGFVVSGNPLTTAAVLLNWSIYPDSGGLPAGNPLTAAANAVWTYTTAPTATGVSAVNGVIDLDLTAAGQNVSLPPGRYWLVTNTRSTFANRWAHYGSVTGSGSFASLTVATNDTGAWAANPSLNGLAYHVQGEVDCGADWLGDSDNPSGSVGTGNSISVTTTLNTAGLPAGTYHGAICIAGNDPRRPRAAIRIELTVAP